jgi:alkanesulfonate monooxygenase SsuD/methylene tetrahydromethanopterin reductase-like flavin-dependent oxidoreductase (luciferase family)
MAIGQVTASNVRGSGRDAPLRFGWRMPMWDPAGAPATSWLPAVRGNPAALRGKYDSVWLSDHFVPGTPWMPPEPDTLECWTATVHFSAAFPEFQYGQIVMGNNYRQPSLLAKAASTMQALTGGKLILGIGAGWMESEYRMYGYEMPRPAIRIQQLDEACQIIRRMWTESPASFQGKHYTLDQAYANPLPNPIPPIMIGGSGEQLTMRVIAKHADWWESGSHSPSEYRRKAGVLAEHCDAVGRDPSSLLHVWQCQVVSMADSEAEARSIAETSLLYHHSTEDVRLVGTPEQILARLEERMEIGVRHFILRFLDFPYTDQALRFAAEVAPKLRRKLGG